MRISVDPPPKKGHWKDYGDHRVWIPDEKVYVLVREGIGVDDSNLNVYSNYRVLTPNAPETIFTVTPYRGSCNPGPVDLGANKDSMYRVQAFKMNPEIDTYPNRTGRTNITIVPPDQHPGYDPNPGNVNELMRNETRHLYRDMFWSADWYKRVHLRNPAYAHWDKHKERYGYTVPGMSLPEEDIYDKDLAPCPPLPVILSDRYDCYDQVFKPVAPEPLEIEANVACITTLDQRFPNVQLKLMNYDNENDVNDPYNIPFAVPNTDTPLIATYNAHGGGIDWLGVAQLAAPSVTHEKIIFQANQDGTYNYWYWYEPPSIDPVLGPQVENAIDPNDWIVGEPMADFSMSCPVGLNREAIHVDDRSTWKDSDCSADRKYMHCDVNMPEGMPDLGDITGYIDGPLQSDHFGLFDGGFGWITSYGVPTYVTPYGEVTASDEGGECLIALLPSDGSTHVKIHVYLNNTIFDYNSSSAHPFTGSPYFRTEEYTGVPAGNPAPIYLGKPINGIDYAGFIDLKVYQADPYVNFAEWLIVDKGIQYSNVNYTAGPSSNPPLYPLPPPAPQIQVPYWPILRTSHGGFRCYPGGQTHTGRVVGQNFNPNGGAFGWNAYPAIWSESTQNNSDAEKFFKRYQKGVRGEKHSQRRSRETQTELEWLGQLDYQLKDTVKNSDIEEIAQELRQAGLLKDKNRLHAKRTLQPSVPHEAVSPSGHKIFWGRNNRQNDEISTKLLKGGDLWFHAYQTPGAHVVLKIRSGQSAAEADILYAAAIAAGYSKAREDSKVEVMVAEAKFVHKPKGGRAGLVNVLKYQTVLVDPLRPES